MASATFSGYQPIGSGPSSSSAQFPSSTRYPPDIQAAAERVNKYETSLPIRLDFESALSYALGPVTGLLLLIFETKNDYVRFHAWQSTLIFASMLVVHFIFMFISSVVSWILFVGDLGLIALLAWKAYENSDTLYRFELPYVGQIASVWVDCE
ncbi:hypothetical protein M427DRAFT_115419 [Gonapodya prolifera JEL478]|uniref:Uncharacterized protein n=1 Tax=Gonapodya prolifera (strain JEL478) TaxID=1344416 RepID=A0A139A2L6_GONPJ|nr:hypothetical protein M427DRAFT_115419 [Gonapodya prolifera JEL478]|eukprot:KXS10991.1 hypothetical protein M427DRAFT_115419 [Gonapodya prolifera JEL478]